MCVHIDPFDPAGSPKCGECAEPKEPVAVKPEKEPVTLDDLVAVDPVLAKLALIDAGLWCVRCNTPIDHHSRCLCERVADFLTESADLEDWLAEHRGSIDDAGFVVSSTMRRAHLKLGRDLPSDIPGQTFAQMDAQANRKRYHGERAVGRYRRPKVTDPSELPV